MRSIIIAAWLALMSASSPVIAQSAPSVTWVTLGTQGGPLPNAQRSQPANLLQLADGSTILVDAGDGAVEQLAGAHVSLAQVRTLFLSHLHFDHTAGVLALIGLRYQTDQPGVLTIYGPSGTKAFVEGLIAAMQPAATAGYGIPGKTAIPPISTVSVVELGDGATVSVGPVIVRAAKNTHYSFSPGSDLDLQYQSIAYRFDAPGRSIVYTGDTGPSDAVVQLAMGADLLVSEMIDVEATVAKVKRIKPTLSGPLESAMVQHLSSHHLTPAQVGELARAANVKSLVLTHFAPGDVSPDVEAKHRTEIGRSYRGPVAFATDLDRF